ncbi:MAG: hypothetical protein K6F53_02840 [Lachnospiraceae bacterium]|nr:hypothetical protein [Lachnospiraceae bacterium]
MKEGFLPYHYGIGKEGSLNYSINNNYKDRFFRKLFGDPAHKKNLLSLYNALNGTSYEDASDLEINTLEDFIFMKMKNDVSCILDGSMMMAEHQSTLNPNMPVRGFLYFGMLYDKYLAPFGDRVSSRA